MADQHGSQTAVSLAWPSALPVRAHARDVHRRLRRLDAARHQGHALGARRQAGAREFKRLVAPERRVPRSSSGTKPCRCASSTPCGASSRSIVVLFGLLMVLLMLTGVDQVTAWSGDRDLHEQHRARARRRRAQLPGPFRLLGSWICSAGDAARATRDLHTLLDPLHTHVLAQIDGCAQEALGTEAQAAASRPRGGRGHCCWCRC